MKRGVLLVLLAVLTAGAAAGADFGISVGGGGTGGFLQSSGTHMEDSGGSPRTYYEMNTNYIFAGAFFFADFTYLLTEFSYVRLWDRIYTNWREEGGGPYSYGSNSTVRNGGAMEFSVFLKYPFQFWRFRLFPLAGVSYTWVLSADEGMATPDAPGDLSCVGFLGGLGLDFALGSHWFIRAEGLYNLRLPSKGQRMLYEHSSEDAPRPNGYELKLGLGFAL